MRLQTTSFACRLDRRSGCDEAKASVAAKSLRQTFCDDLELEVAPDFFMVFSRSSYLVAESCICCMDPVGGQLVYLLGFVGCAILSLGSFTESMVLF